MTWGKLWCAGILMDCAPNTTMNRFHITCNWCRARRRYYGKFTTPPFYIKHDIPWKKTKTLWLNPKTGQGFIHTKWETLQIDPRGHLLMLRCSAIVTLCKLAGLLHKVHHQIGKRVLTVCEGISNLTFGGSIEV